MSEGGWFWLALLAVGLWLGFGGGWVTVRGWLGQDVYVDQVAALEGHARQHRIGYSADVWLVKNGAAGPEKIALFFGYYDDWDACYDFARLYMQAYPSDSYTCSLAN
jgi:hypothetical protein